MTTADDRRWMRRCLELAARAEGRTHPNPMVGSVVVAGGEMVGEGYHRRAGTPHAEIVAMRRAGERARGATLYVSLEPCSHHGRTPPCADAIIEAGIRRVVYAAADPIADHGGGSDALQAAGLRVVGGILSGEAEAQNRGFFTVARRGRPFVVAKAAMSADGKVATRRGDSQWITGEDARGEGHRLRDRLDGIAVGLGTVRADDPRLTARGRRNARDPVRVVFDSQLRTPSAARVLPANSESRARCVILTRSDAPERSAARLEHRGAEIVRIRGGRGGYVNLARGLAALAADIGLTTLLVEGGSDLLGGLLDEDLIDELQLFVAPMVLGGPAPSWAGGRGAAQLADARRFAFGEPRRLGPDLQLVARRLR